LPYIELADRDRLDPLIEDLTRHIRSMSTVEGDATGYAGLLNYTCTRLALGVIPEKKYGHIATVTGVFQNMISEFYRRYATPYEEDKMAETGDVFMPET
jgi:hypothetical protein